MIIISSFSKRAIEIIKHIPAGKVSSYGRIAAFAGNSKGARLIVMLLNTYSRKENLPWQRIVNMNGQISLAKGDGYELQKSILEAEGIEFGENDRIDFDKYLWRPLEDDRG